MTNYTFATKTGTYTATRRKYLDKNGNPMFDITAPQLTESMPVVPGFRRSTRNRTYSTQSYNIEIDLQHFITKFEAITGGQDNE